MSVINRNQHEKGRLKLPQQACPSCSEPCVVYQSGRQTILTRLFYLRCTNPLCGWTGTGTFEITGTIQKGSRFYAKHSAEPPEIHGKTLEAVEEDIKLKSQETLIQRGE